MTSKVHLVGALAASMILGGCGGKLVSSAIPEPASPVYNPGQVSAPLHHLPPGVTAVALSLSSVVPSVSVGGTLQFTATIKLSNGQTVYDGQLLQWSLGDPNAGIVDANGLMTPSQPRTTTVYAQLGALQASAPVTITPAVYAWQQVASPTQEDLFATQMISRTDAWAVGAHGTILHYFGNQWQAYMGNNAKDETLRAISFADNGIGWIVGQKGEEGKPAGPVAYAHAANNTWVSMPIPGSGGLRGVYTQDINHAWAVGSDDKGKVLIEKWDGRGWTQDKSYTGSGALNAIQMVGSEGWAVGTTGSDALILHFDGTRWASQNLPFASGVLQSSELKGLCMINGQQGYAVGWAKPTIGFTKGLLMKFDSRSQQRFQWSEWSEVTGADSKIQYLDQVPLNGIAMLGGDQGWLLGDTISPRRWLPVNPVNDLYGNLMAFNGTGYSVDNNFYKYNLSAQFLGVNLTPQGDGVICGRKGYLMQRTYDYRQAGSNQAATQPGTVAVPGTVNY